LLHFFVTFAAVLVITLRHVGKVRLFLLF